MGTVLQDAERLATLAAWAQPGAPLLPLGAGGGLPARSNELCQLLKYACGWLCAAKCYRDDATKTPFMKGPVTLG